MNMIKKFFKALVDALEANGKARAQMYIKNRYPSYE